MVGLADSLTGGAMSTAANRGGSSRQQSTSHAPKLVSASEKKRTKDGRVMKVAIIGPPGSGKTYSIFSLVKYLATVKHLNPEQIRIEIIDLDGGMDELTDQQIIPDEYLDCLQISLCKNFSEVVDATREAYERLKEHKKQHGAVGAWIVVDNMEKAWNYPQEDFCQAVYGMSLVERMKTARKSQVEAKKLGQKGESVFNMNLDWGVIKPMYSDWAKSFEVCGVNFLWLSSWKPDEVKDLEGNVKEIREKFGNGENNLKVSYIIKKYMDEKGRRRADFVKSRSTKELPKNLLDTSWFGIFNELEKLEGYENREREAQLKREVFGTKPEPKAEVTTESVVGAEKEQRVNEIMDAAVAHSVKEAEKAADTAAIDW